jgi:hypothetical protein
MRLYLETSVPNFLFVTDAPERRRLTYLLFAEIEAREHQAWVSTLYLREVRQVDSPLLRYQLEGNPRDLRAESCR